MRSEHFLAVCLELADCRVDLSLEEIRQRAEQWERDNNRYIVRPGQGSFPMLVWALRDLRNPPGPGWIPDPPDMLEKTTLLDCVQDILSQKAPFTGDTESGWCLPYPQPEELDDEDRRFREGLLGTQMGFDGRLDIPPPENLEMRKFFLERPTPTVEEVRMLIIRLFGGPLLDKVSRPGFST